MTNTSSISDTQTQSDEDLSKRHSQSIDSIDSQPIDSSSDGDDYSLSSAQEQTPEYLQRKQQSKLYFIAKELSKCQKLENSNQFEDRFEQFGQMKGTFKEESDPQKELYFWGSISKKYLSSEPIKRRIIRICGFNKKG